MLSARPVGWAPAFMIAPRAAVVPSPRVAPAGQVAEIAIGAAALGALSLGAWLAYKGFGVHQPAFQPQPITANPTSISLMQAQMKWMARDIQPEVYAPNKRATWSAVGITGQFDAATVAAAQMVDDPNCAISPGSCLQFLDPVVFLNVVATDPVRVITAIDNEYQRYIAQVASDQANLSGAMPAPKPAGQAEWVIPVLAAGALGFGAWAAYKGFGSHPPAFQNQTTDASGLSSIQVTPQTIALMQAQLHWIGTHPVPQTGFVPDIYVTTLIPAALTAYAAVGETGRFDAPTTSALAYALSPYFTNIDPNSTQPTAGMQRDPTTYINNQLETIDGMRNMLLEIDGLYQTWTNASATTSAAAAPKPAGQALPDNAPPGAFGVDIYGQCVDASGNVLDPSGQTLGPGNHTHANAATCGAASVPVPAPLPTAPPPVTVAPPAPVVPSGLPTGPVRQLGSSITPGVVALAVGGVLAVGVLAFVLTRTAPTPEPAPVRAARAGRRYETRTTRTTTRSTR